MDPTGVWKLSEGNYTDSGNISGNYNFQNDCTYTHKYSSGGGDGESFSDRVSEQFSYQHGRTMHCDASGVFSGTGSGSASASGSGTHHEGMWGGTSTNEDYQVRVNRYSYTGQWNQSYGGGNIVSSSSSGSGTQSGSITVSMNPDHLYPQYRSLANYTESYNTPTGTPGFQYPDYPAAPFMEMRYPTLPRGHSWPTPVISGGEGMPTSLTAGESTLPTTAPIKADATPHSVPAMGTPPPVVVPPTPPAPPAPDSGGWETVMVPSSFGLVPAYLPKKMADSAKASNKAYEVFSTAVAQGATNNLIGMVNFIIVGISVAGGPASFQMLTDGTLPQISEVDFLTSLDIKDPDVAYWASWTASGTSMAIDVFFFLEGGVKVLVAVRGVSSAKVISAVKEIFSGGNFRDATGAFNPSSKVVGEGLGKLAGREVTVTKKGLSLVESHLLQFGENEANNAMLDRLRNALARGEKISGADASFYVHEAHEATLMRQGVSYSIAHDAALLKYRVSPYSIYAPEVIKKLPHIFNNNWRSFWRD